MAAAEKVLGVPLKWVSLLLMVVQTVSMVLLLRVSRTQHVDGPRYLNTTAIFLGEVLKLLASLVLHWCSSADAAQFFGDLSFRRGALRPLDLAKTGVPSLLYAVQNNLLYVGISHLSAGTYQASKSAEHPSWMPASWRAASQKPSSARSSAARSRAMRSGVTCQFKILTTAFLSVLILGTKLGYEKWGALLLLTLGVALVDTSGGGQAVQASAASADAGASSGGTALGLVCVVGACFLSGLAGVCLEKLLKQSSTSLWVRNVQLALSGAAFAGLIAWRADGAAIRRSGPLQGYSAVVWAVVVCQALGGLLVAAVMKYADNILKCFGCAIAIVLTCTFSAAVLHEIRPDRHFAAGVTLVLVATGIYNLGLPKAAERRPLLATKDKSKYDLPMSAPVKQ